ncbi:MAG TPA: hypothetical protein PKD24_09185 [Pyrinomonadaceae bacterium]|nr:hypothetical protein [Pyrinomonadaceae bacterium]HMP65758.1 hypothetical protein [Pyrinomonadaceae bacterium]
MVWLWKKWSEYEDAVGPSVVQGQGEFRLLQDQSLMEQIQSLTEAEEALARAIDAFYKKYDELSLDEIVFSCPKDFEDMKSIMTDIAYSGEWLIMHNRRLIDAANTGLFLSYTENANRVSASWLEHGMLFNIKRLLFSAKTLLEKHRDMIIQDSLLLENAEELPDELSSDFMLARDLFSVGQDETAVLIAGRGLEGVLRAIARAKSIQLKIKSDIIPADDADFNDLIELMYRLKWKTSGRRLVSVKIRNLLHFVRSHRNSSAHAEAGEREPVDNPREIANIIVSTAIKLWEASTASRARFITTEVEKTW